MPNKPKYALAGLSADQLPPSLQQQLELVSVGSSGIDGVLVAGSGAPGASTTEDFAKFLNSGLALAAYQPDKAVGDAIAGATGRVAVPAPLVLYRKDGSSISSSIVGNWGGDTSNQVSENDEPAAKPPAKPAEAAPPAPKPLLKKSAAPAAPPATLEVEDNFFAPPRKLLQKKDDPAPTPTPIPNIQVVEKLVPSMSRASYIYDFHSFSETVELDKKENYDTIMNASKVNQKMQYKYRGDFHIYWVDGDGNQQPHFVVIFKQFCIFNPCFSGRTNERNFAWEGWTKGFFCAWIDFEPVTIIAHGATSMELEDWAPRGHSVKGGGLFNFAYPMQLRGEGGQGGRSYSQPFTAQYDSGNKFEDWKYKDYVDMGAKKPHWRFHLDRVWDPEVSNLWSFRDWCPNIYNPDHVKDFGPQCINTMYLTSIAAWTIKCPTKVSSETGGIEPQGVTLECYFGIRPFMAAVHARAGCLHQTRHLWYHHPYFHFQKFIRLDDICKR